MVLSVETASSEPPLSLVMHSSYALAGTSLTAIFWLNLFVPSVRFFQELEPETWQTRLPLRSAKLLMDVSLPRTRMSWWGMRYGPPNVTSGRRFAVIE